MQGLKFFRVAGAPEAIWRRLGVLAKPVFDAWMAQRSAWEAVSRWRGSAFARQLCDAAQLHFPARAPLIALPCPDSF